MAWYERTQNAVYDSLCAVFGLDPDSSAAEKRFIPAYTEGMTVPQADSNMNVCYYAVAEDDTTRNLDYVMVGHARKQITIRKSVPVRVILTFYGPNADDDAELFWSNLLIDTGKLSPQAILSQNSIALNGQPARPHSLPELEGAIWRRRCDVILSLAVYDEQTQASSYVDTPPDVTIEAE